MCFVTNQVYGTGNSKYRYVATNQSQPSTHTTVLSMIISGGKNSPTPPHSDIYSAALAPARNQGFVDRSEDMIVEQIQPVMFVRPLLAVDGHSHDVGNHQSNATVQTGSSSHDHTNHQSNVTIHTGTIPSVCYKSNVHSMDYRCQDSKTGYSLTTNRSVDNKFSSLRKTSLQVTPGSRKNDFAYERLESYSSESNIDKTLQHKLSGKKIKTADYSCDDLYESTATVTSTLRSESVDNSLFSLTEESIRDTGTQKAQSVGNNSFSLFNISSSTTDGQIYVDSQNEQTPQPSAIYAKVNKSQKQKQDFFQNESQIAKFDNADAGFEMIENTEYTVTCTAQIKDGNQSVEQGNETLVNIMETSMSFDDTIKAFEDFVDVSLDSESKSNDYNESQTERAENVIEYKPAQLTKNRKGGIATREGIATTREIDNIYTGTASDGQEINVSTNSETKFNTAITQSIEDQFSERRNVTNIIIGSTSTSSNVDPTNGTMINRHTLDDELDRSVNELLIGIDVDTAEWTTVKDRGHVFDEADNDIWEVALN